MPEPSARLIPQLRGDLASELANLPWSPSAPPPSYQSIGCNCAALEERVRELEARLEAVESDRALRQRAAELGIVLPREGGGARA